jgi:hypothetical protein
MNKFIPSSLAVCGFALLSAVVPAGMANAVQFNFDGGTDFDFRADGTTKAGAGTSTATLNTTTGHGGFDNFFGNSYGRLGALDSATANNTSDHRGSSSASSKNPVSFTAADLAANDTIRIQFSYALDGTAGNPGDDEASVFLLDEVAGDTINFGSSINTLSGPADGSASGIAVQEFTLPSAQLAEDTDYLVSFQLLEKNDGNANNTAFGFDQVTVESVPFGIEPTAGAAIVGILAAWKYRQRNRQLEGENSAT